MTESIKNKTNNDLLMDRSENNQEENKHMEDQCDLSIDEMNQEYDSQHRNNNTGSYQMSNE